jgi:hypothetical protein
MEATYTVAQMETEHFAGGFHSADVRSTFATIKDADPQTKHELYRDAFNEAYDLATEIQNHPRYVEGKADACWTYVEGKRIDLKSTRGTVDLSEEGLGTVTIITREGLQDEETGRPKHKGIVVMVDAFSPDPMFHFKEERALKKVPRFIDVVWEQDHPRHWNTEWLLQDDREVKSDDVELVDASLVGILDYVETLREVNGVLNPTYP